MTKTNKERPHLIPGWVPVYQRNSELKGTETIGVTDEVRFNMPVDNRGPEGLKAVSSSDANAVVGEGLHS